MNTKQRKYTPGITDHGQKRHEKTEQDNKYRVLEIRITNETDHSIDRLITLERTDENYVLRCKEKLFATHVFNDVIRRD